MATYYLDTSALVKRYINEPGSMWVRQLCDERGSNNELLHVLFVGRIAIVEVAAAIAVLVRRNIILSGVGKYAYERFNQDWATAYQISELHPSPLTKAATLAQRHPLKANDAVHLALALETRQLLIENELDLIFVSGDTRLLEAAQAEGLAAENPFTYSHLDNSPQENLQ